MFLRKLRISLTKLILPFVYRIFYLLKSNSRAINFFTEKRKNANNAYDFQKIINELLKNKKLIGLDVGAQGGFNSDKFFPEKYNKYFKPLLVEPLGDSLEDKQNSHTIIKKGFWSSAGDRKLYVLNNRPQSSSMYEPDKKSLTIYDFKEKDFYLFDVKGHAVFSLSADRQTVTKLASLPWAADIGIDAKRGLLYVPSLTGKRLVIYKLSTK